MAKTLDVYRDWLGIQETARPLNFYQLLRLKRFEDNSPKIREHYRKLIAHVRKHINGEFAAQSQALLKELNKAVLCLTDARRKREYDNSLGRKRDDDDDGKRRTLEEILTAQEAVNPEQLAKAQKFSQAAGMELRDALIQTKAATADTVMAAYAESVGLPYVDANDLQLDEALIRQIPAVLARQNSCAPVMVDDNQLLMASPNMIAPNVEEELRLRMGMPIRTVLCTPAGINAIMTKYYSRELAAAEMAAGGPNRPTKDTTRVTGKTTDQGQTKDAPAKQGNGAEAGKEKPADDKPAPGSPEALKRRRDISIIAANFTVMIYEVAYVASGFFGDYGFPGVFVGFVLAGIVGGLTWKFVK